MLDLYSERIRCPVLGIELHTGSPPQRFRRELADAHACLAIHGATISPQPKPKVDSNNAAGVEISCGRN